MRVRAYVPLPLSETSPRTALECGSVYGGGGGGGGDGGDRLCFVCARARTGNYLLLPQNTVGDFTKRKTETEAKKAIDGGRRSATGDGRRVAPVMFPIRPPPPPPCVRTPFGLVPAALYNNNNNTVCVPHRGQDPTQSTAA